MANDMQRTAVSANVLNPTLGAFLQRDVEWYAFRESGGQHALGDSGFLRPIGDALSATVVRQHSVGACVAALLMAQRPRAVVFRVGAVVVQALKRVFLGWSWSHIAEEGGKAGDPLIAHGNASTAIVSILGEVWVAASGFHGRPDSVFRSACATVGAHSSARGLALKAAT